MFKRLMEALTNIQQKNVKFNEDLKAYIADKRFREGGGISPLPDVPNPSKPLKIPPLFTQVIGALLAKRDAEAQGTQQSIPPTPTPTPTPGWFPYKKAYDTFYSRRGSPPVSRMTELMAKLTYEDPLLRRNPGLVPGVPLLETSGGKNITYKNNPVNWGILVQKRGDFNPSSWEEAITKMATGVARRQKDYTKRKLLDDWRQTGNLESFGEWYAPEIDNPENGGKVYGRRLKSFDDEINALIRELSGK